MQKFNKNIRQATLAALILLVLMWLGFWADAVFPYNLNQWGIHPEKKEGLWGILFSPLLHGGWGHILSNSFPAIVLTFMLFYFYREVALIVLLVSWVMVGVLVWISGGDGVHIGMSGVIYALAAFLFFSGLFRKYKPLIGISFFIAFMYGSLIWGVLPIKEGISWEGHLWGAVMGIILALFYRKKGPQLPKYQYEIEEEMGMDSDEPIEVDSIAEERKKNEQKSEIKIRYNYTSKKDRPSEE